MEVPSPGINRLPAATGHLGRAACGPVLPAHHPLGQLAFCRLWLPSLSSSCPPGQPFGMGAGARPGPASSKCRSEARRERSWFSRPGSSGSSHDCSRRGSGFPAPLTSLRPLLPLRARCPWVTSVSPCPSVWDQGSSGWRPHCSRRLGSFSEGIKGKFISRSLAGVVSWWGMEEEMSTAISSPFSHHPGLSHAGRRLLSRKALRTKHILPKHLFCHKAGLGREALCAPL